MRAQGHCLDLVGQLVHRRLALLQVYTLDGTGLAPGLANGLAKGAERLK
jgi:hypothetical protein